MQKILLVVERKVFLRSGQKKGEGVQLESQFSSLAAWSNTGTALHTCEDKDAKVFEKDAKVFESGEGRKALFQQVTSSSSNNGLPQFPCLFYHEVATR
jgi:hypothetical protein